jgi:hypothetical protein
MPHLAELANKDLLSQYFKIFVELWGDSGS